MIRAGVLAVALALPLAGCGKGLSVIAGLAGGGPNVAANVQAGKNNAQTIGQTRFIEQKLVRPQARTIEQSSGDTQVRADSVRRVVVNEAPPWLVIVALIGWLVPTPPAMGRAIWAKLFNKKGVA